MRGEYHLWAANCQTFVDLLLQRIVEGSAPFVPFGYDISCSRIRSNEQNVVGFGRF